MVGPGQDGRGGHRVQVLTGSGDPDGPGLDVAAGELAAFVADREESARREGTTPPRWTWERTGTVYPQLLAAGTRVSWVKAVAVLAGASVSDAIGKFTYTNGPDGTINPIWRQDTGTCREEDPATATRFDGHPF